MKLTRENAILPFFPTADLRGKEGYAVKLNAGQIELIDDPNEPPFGVIIHGTNTTEKTSVAITAGGLAGTVKVKLESTVSQVGLNLQTTANGTFAPDAGAGNRYLSAQALETGVSDELIEAVLYNPVALS